VRRSRYVACCCGVSEKELGEAALADFTPRYDPWDQRLCLVPDGDLFEALRSGRRGS
jgi:monooxygenase